MSLLIRYLSLIVIALSVPHFTSETAARAEQSEASAAALEPGRKQRKAILDVLREAIKGRQGRDVVFVVHDLRVWNGWAWLHVLAQSADGKNQYGHVSGLLVERGEAWELLEVPCNDENIPACAGHADFIEGLKKRFPDVPAALFTAAGTQAEPTSNDATTSHPGSLSVDTDEDIEFDRDFRGLLDEPRMAAESTPTREQLRERLALAHSKLQSMTGTVQELKTNREELIARLRQLDNELDSQRQATAQAHFARHALASELSSLRDKVLALTDAIDAIRTNQQTADPQLTDLREQLTTRQEAAQRFDSRITTIQSDLAAIHAQVSELSSAQQNILDEAADSREQFSKTQAATDTQFQSIDKSLQALQTGRDELVTELAKVSDELKNQNQSLAQSQTAHTTKLSELATRKSVDDIAAAQQLLKEEDTLASEKLQAMEQSLQALQTGRDELVTELAKISDELKNQRQSLAQSQTAQTTKLSELATRKSLDDIAATQHLLKEEDTLASEKLEQMEKSLQELRNGRQHLTSELAKLIQEFASQREADTQSDAARTKLLDGLADIRSNMVVASEAIKSGQAGRKTLGSELDTLQQQIARQSESFAKSGSETAAMRTELAAISDQLKVLRETQQATSEQTAQQQEKLKQELTSAREQLATISKSLPSGSIKIQDLVSNMANKLKQELETQRQRIAQSDTDRRKLVSELSGVRNRLGALDQAEQAARVSRTRLSAELHALRKEIADTTHADRPSSKDAAGTGVAVKPEQDGNMAAADNTSSKSDASRDLQLAGVRSRDQLEPATAPHPPRPRTQLGSRRTWKITPGPETSDGQLTHRASGTITREPSRITSRNMPDRAETAGDGTPIASDRDRTGTTPAIIGTIALPAESTALPKSPQIASVTSVSTFTDLNTLSDFDAIDPFLQAWTEDWERKDLEAYLAHYSSDFQPSGGLDLDTWRDKRRNSLFKPAFIDVKISNIQKRSTGASSAQLTFNQTYSSNIYSDRVFKTLFLRWEDERWKIVREQSRSNN